MARFHLRRAMQDARSADELCRLLGDLLPQGALRERFVTDALGLIAAQQDQSLRSPVPGQPQAAEAVERVTRALAHSVGPLARHLVRRALARATTLDQLRELCLKAIDGTDERERFRAMLADMRHPGSLAVSVRDLPSDRP